MNKSNIFIISGPSGAGEDSIIEGLYKYFPIERVKTTTTRQMRPGESQGSPYYFISKDEFQRGIKNGDFVEHAEEYNGNSYGVTKEEFSRVKSSGKVGIWKIEYKGVIKAKEMFPEIIAIFIMAPSIEILEDRIRRRGSFPEEYIKERTKYTKEWLKYKNIYDYTVINEENKLDKAIKETAEIIKKHL
jgi:guanylate kinase